MRYLAVLVLVVGGCSPGGGLTVVADDQEQEPNDSLAFPQFWAILAPGQQARAEGRAGVGDPDFWEVLMDGDAELTITLRSEELATQHYFVVYVNGVRSRFSSDTCEARRNPGFYCAKHRPAVEVLGYPVDGDSVVVEVTDETTNSPYTLTVEARAAE